MSNNTDLMKLAKQARDRKGLIAGPLFKYQGMFQLSDHHLAESVGVPVSNLGKLGLCEWPESASDIAMIAEHVQANQKALLDWFAKIKKIEPLQALMKDQQHIRRNALRLAGIYLQNLDQDIVEQEMSELDEDILEDDELSSMHENLIEKIADEVVKIGKELSSLSDAADPGLTADLSWR